MSGPTSAAAAVCSLPVTPMLVFLYFTAVQAVAFEYLLHILHYNIGAHQILKLAVNVRMSSSPRLNSPYGTVPVHSFQLFLERGCVNLLTQQPIRY